MLVRHTAPLAALLALQPLSDVPRRGTNVHPPEWDLTALARRGLHSGSEVDSSRRTPGASALRRALSRPLPIQVAAADPRLRYVGRFLHQPNGPARCAWSGCMVEFSTTARELNVLLCDHPRQPQEHQYFQVLVDGLAVAHQKLERQDCRYRIELPAATRAHRVSLIKQTEAEYGETVFFGLELAEDTLLLQRPPERKHRLMILGDSVTAGFGVDAGDNAVKNEPDWFTRTQNLAVTYGMLAASTLALDYVPLAYSGKGVSRNQDPSDPVVYGMLLPRLLTNPDGPAFPDEPTPDAILVNLGTNDFWTNRNIRSFTSAYTTLLQQLRERFAAAPILCTIGPMLQDRWHYPRLSYARAGIYRAIQARRAAGDRALYYFELAPQNIPADGVGVDWHPSRTTHAKVANQLIAVLRGLLGW